MKTPVSLTHRFDAATGELEGGRKVERRLADLAGCFADGEAWAAAVAAGNPVVYQVTAVAHGAGPGDLHTGMGVLFPGKVGGEYFLTKGHLHERREAAEVYIGLAGEGRMLLECEHTGESRMERLAAGTVVYVPGHTAHRTVNTGTEPLVYFGIYPADAGHDYGALAERNFRCVIVEENGVPALRERQRGRDLKQESEPSHE